MREWSPASALQTRCASCCLALILRCTLVLLSMCCTLQLCSLCTLSAALQLKRDCPAFAYAIFNSHNSSSGIPMGRHCCGRTDRQSLPAGASLPHLGCAAHNRPSHRAVSPAGVVGVALLRLRLGCVARVPGFNTQRALKWFAPRTHCACMRQAAAANSPAAPLSSGALECPRVCRRRTPVHSLTGMHAKLALFHVASSCFACMRTF